MNKWFFTFGFLFLVLGNGFAGSPQKRSTYPQEQETMQQLRSIQFTLELTPEQAVKELDVLIKYSIDKDLKQSLAFGYLLMGRAYNKLHQTELALHYLSLAKNHYSGTDKKTSSKSSYKPESMRESNFSKSSVAPTPSYSLPSQYYIDLGEVYTQIGDYEESNIQYSKYQNLEPNGRHIIPVKYAKAENYYALKNYEHSITIYEELLEVEKQRDNDLQTRECYSRLSACYISDGDSEKGLYYYNLSMEGLSIDTTALVSIEMIQNNAVVSSALRSQDMYEEEVQVRNKAIEISRNGIEYLRLAQTYFKAQNLAETESSLDHYFKNISFDFTDQSEIEVIKKMAIKLQSQQKNNKAFKYLLHYQELSDTLDNRLNQLEEISRNIGFLGFKNSLQLEALQKEKELAENTITHLKRESELKEENIGFQKTIIFLMGFAILLSVIALGYILRVSKQRRIANQQLALRSLRSQMNPHFIFNASNSVNSFISTSDERSANKFLTEFSTLMRTVMENSEHDFISLRKEIDIDKIYLELEHFRFKDKFEYQLIVDPDIDTEEMMIPPMLIQPYIENAIWHGLRYKETKGELIVRITESSNQLKITIQDNGIGRTRSAEIKTKNQKTTHSTAIKNIQERVSLFNSLHKIKIEVAITNLNTDNSGTVVTLLIPQV